MVPVLIAGGVLVIGAGYEIWTHRSAFKKIRTLGLGALVNPLHGTLDYDQIPTTDAGDIDVVALGLKAGNKPAVVAAPKVVGKSPGGQPIVSTTPVIDGKQTLSDQVASSGSPTAKAAAALLDSVASGGASPVLVTAFQTAVNADTSAKKLAGKLPVTGIFDLPTSAALNVYTGGVYYPDTQGKQFAVLPAVILNDIGAPGAVAFTGTLLYSYLKQHGNDGSDTLKNFVSQFQHDVNTDPKFSGPAGKPPTVPSAIPKMVKSPLTVDGSYGPRTADALAVTSFDRIAP
jgi:hypothetical protein